MIKKNLNLKKKQINKLAYITKAISRKPRKVRSDILFEAICFISVNKEFSFKNIADFIFEKFNISITKQAIGKRLTKEGTKNMLKEIVEAKVLKQMGGYKKDFKGMHNKFNRILIQDSTIIKLPIRLYKLFSGTKNGKAAVANARIQFIYDILNKKFIKFSIDSFSKNDLVAAPEIEVLGKDLWLRDRGYSSLEAFTKIIENGGSVVFRYKSNTVFYDKKGSRIDLVALLKKNPSINMKAWMGNKKIEVWLVAEPAGDIVANERRRKANIVFSKTRNKKKHTKENMTKEYSFLCGFTIFCSTIKRKLSFKIIFEIYSLRWRIEIIFKAWKSNLNFANIHNVSEHQLYILMYCRFIMNHIIFSKFYNKFLEPILKKYNKTLSIMALTKGISLDIYHYLKCLSLNKFEYLIEKLSRFCTYEKRNRQNYYQKELQTLISLEAF